MERVDLSGRQYFVFGFIKGEEFKPVIGYYTEEKNMFVLDCNCVETGDVLNKFICNEISLPLVTLNGITNRSYSEVLSKEYLQKECFYVDPFYYALLDENVEGKIIISSGEKIELEVILPKGVVWDSGRYSESCNVWFNTEEFLWSIYLNIEIMKPMPIREQYD